MHASCVIFDLDGVLIDTCDWHFEALNAALMQHLNISISRSDHESEFNGLPTRVKLQMLNIPDKLAIKIQATKQALTLQSIKDKIRPNQSKIYMLEELTSDKILTACVTNSIKATAHLMLERLGILRMFDAVVTNEDVKKPKPDPEGYKLAMDCIGADPRQTIIFEDSEIGLRAAKSSGAKKVIKVSDPSEVTLEYVRSHL
jgi:beta-phosphoglucomutase